MIYNKSSAGVESLIPVSGLTLLGVCNDKQLYYSADSQTGNKTSFEVSLKNLQNVTHVFLVMSLIAMNVSYKSGVPTTSFGMDIYAVEASMGASISVTTLQRSDDSMFGYTHNISDITTWFSGKDITRDMLEFSVMYRDSELQTLSNCLATVYVLGS